MVGDSESVIIFAIGSGIAAELRMRSEILAKNGLQRSDIAEILAGRRVRIHHRNRIFNRK